MAAIAELIEDLADEDPRVRREAARELGERGAREAVPALVGSIRRCPAGDAESTEEHAARAAAAVALGKIGDPASAPALLDAIADPFNLGTAASTALGRLDPPPFEALLRTTRDANAWRRARAVLALAEIGDRRAVETMVTLLGDGEAAVRRAAASAFEKLRDERAIDPLTRVLANDPSSLVRTYAAMALGALGARHAVPALLEATRAREPNLRRAAARALCRIGDPRSADDLARLASEDPDTIVRQVVSRYLNPREGQREH